MRFILSTEQVTPKHWLLKSEPEEYSWEQLCSAGSGVWDGVRNYQACSNLKQMSYGDLAFFYHTGVQRSIVGIVKVTKTAYPDPTDPEGRFVVVEVEPVVALQHPVSLAQMRLMFVPSKLLKQPRLSVVPVGDDEWDLLLAQSASRS